MEGMRLPDLNRGRKDLGFLSTKDGQALQTYPSDEMTGLPLCYAPSFNLPNPRNKRRVNDRLADWEHLLPKAEVRNSNNNPVVRSDIAKVALYGSRIQWVDYNQHHLKKNHIYRGPKHPHTVLSLLKFFVFAEADYIPPDVVDFTGKEPVIRPISKRELNLIRYGKHLKCASSPYIKGHLLDYVFKNGFEEIDKERALEFVQTEDRERKLYLAHTLAAKMVEIVIDPIAEPYKIAKREHLIDPSLPNSPVEYLKRRITPENKQMIHQVCKLFGSKQTPPSPTKKVAHNIAA